MIFDLVHSNNSQEKERLPNANPRTKDIFGSFRGLSLFEECHQGTIFDFYIMQKCFSNLDNFLLLYDVSFFCTGQCHKDLESNRQSDTEEPLIGKGIVKNRRKQFEHK